MRLLLNVHEKLFFSGNKTAQVCATDVHLHEYNSECIENNIKHDFSRHKCACVH